MNRPVCWISALVLVALSVVIALQVDAQMKRQPQPGRAVRLPAKAIAAPRIGFDGLELRLGVDQNQFLLGEPVVAYVSLANTGSKAVGVFDLLTPEHHYVQYQITRPNGATEKYMPYMLEDPHTPPVLLKPGEKITAVAKLFFGEDGWVFRTAGTYKVRATYLGRVKSNELSLRVVRGSSAADRTAGDLVLKTPDAGRFLYLDGGDHLTAGKAALQRISDRHGGSALAGYANFALGSNLSVDFANFKTNKLRRADLGGANRLLERSADSLPRSAYFSIGLLGQLNKNYTAQSNVAKINATKVQLQTVVNGLAPEVKAFSQHMLLLHKVPSTLQLQMQSGIVQPSILAP